MIPNSRKSWRFMLVVPLLVAMLALSQLLGLRAPAVASHSGALAMMCGCGSAVQHTSLTSLRSSPDIISRYGP
jgi:uncharacterized membrane protein AbrB (regulator of aidB expression)